jgi:DNA-binding NtrC family response regulator
MPEPAPNRKGRPKGSAAFPWRAFFHQSKTPVFVLGKTRRLRYANPAWEGVSGLTLGEALGLVCSTRRHSSPLAVALAPSAEALEGRPDKVRRPAAPNRTGPPWWDVSFTPLVGEDGLIGVVGVIEVVGEPVPAAARRVSAEVIALRDRHGGAFNFDLFSGESPEAERFVAHLRHAAKVAAPVWVVGEPGSGKETAARVIHHAGAWRERMFVALDCAGLQPFLVESMLLGHGGLAGSARVGTVYLKEPAALPRDLQQRIADLFTANEPNTPRLISGSALTAAVEVSEGRLAPAFHTALSVLELRVPPLREWIDDLPRFQAHMVPGSEVEPAAIEDLKAVPWPGNLRELARVLAQAAAAAGTAPIRREHFEWELRVKAGVGSAPPPEPGVKLDVTLETIEKRLIRMALTRTKGNTSKAAELLGIWRARLLRRIEALELGTVNDSG